MTETTSGPICSFAAEAPEWHLSVFFLTAGEGPLYQTGTAPRCTVPPASILTHAHRPRPTTPGICSRPSPVPRPGVAVSGHPTEQAHAGRWARDRCHQGPADRRRAGPLRGKAAWGVGWWS